LVKLHEMRYLIGMCLDTSWFFCISGSIWC